MRVKRWPVVLAVAGALALVVACGGDQADDTASTSPAESGDDLVSMSVDRELSIEMRDLAFEPTELMGQMGEVIEMRFRNGGAILHDFTIDEMDAEVMEMMGGSGAGVDMHMDEAEGAHEVAMHLALDAGQEGRMRLRVHEPGTYTYYCTVPGHREAGMMGTFTVE